MRVWIDQDCCTGAGLCVDRCPDLFIVLEDGIGYLRIDDVVISDPAHPVIAVPRHLEDAVVDAAERCPGECIFLEADLHAASNPDEGDIVDADIR
jgi:ferredoxin